MELIVGDNPFHGISHLSQKRARTRSIDGKVLDSERAAQLVKISIQNGATAFMFSVSETTLSILKTLASEEITPDLYAIVPYAYEYVRLATKLGGISGLAKKVSKQVVFSRNIFTVASNLLGLIRASPEAFLKTYVVYELSRIKSAAGKDLHFKSILLHEIITDMALAFDLDYLFKSYIDFLSKYKIQPGFETRNFAYLVSKFNEWGLDLSKIKITAPFNNIGFQMNPSKDACEEALVKNGKLDVIAMSILASGYVKMPEAIEYLTNLKNLNGVVVGVSKENHAQNTFTSLKKLQ